MGAGAAVPEKIDITSCEELAGESFVKDEFLAMADSDGFITKKQLMEYSQKKSPVEESINVDPEKNANDNAEAPTLEGDANTVRTDDGYPTDPEESEDETELYANIKPEFQLGLTLGDLLALQAEPEGGEGGEEPPTPQVEPEAAVQTQSDSEVIASQ